MLSEVLLLLAGLALIILGADWLVDGASSIARKLGISEFIIGLTIVGMGTSAPELVVSLIGAINGNADVAVGNVIGSNIFNTLLILGITGLILPMTITPETKRRDIPVNILVTLLLIVLGSSATIFHFGDNRLGRLEGILLLVLFAGYMILCFKTGKSAETQPVESTKEKAGRLADRTGIATIMVLLGLGGLIAGGEFFVNSATSIAKDLGVSDKFIAITLLAGGTSMPELATCIVAAVKKRGQLALGNIIGSNIFNILMIIGIAATVTPLNFVNVEVDLGVMLLASLLILAACRMGRKNELDRLDASLLLLCECGYLIWLFKTL